MAEDIQPHKLTPEQIAQMPGYIKKCHEHAWTTAEINVDEGMEGIRQYYKLCNHPPPKIALVVDSPFQMSLVAAAANCVAYNDASLCVNPEVGSQISSFAAAIVETASKVGLTITKDNALDIAKKYSADVRRMVYSLTLEIAAHVIPEAFLENRRITQEIKDNATRVVTAGFIRLVESVTEPRGKITPTLKFRLDYDALAQDILNASTSTGVKQKSKEKISVLSALVEAVKAAWTAANTENKHRIVASITEGWQSFIGGNTWIDTIAGLGFLKEVVGVDLGKVTDAYNAMDLITKHLGWWWGHTEFVVLCRRPKTASIGTPENGNADRNGQPCFHNESGPALELHDGFKTYSVRGVRVPENIILNKEGITIDEILAERDAEVQRIMIEFYGRDRFLRDGEGKVIASDTVAVRPGDPTHTQEIVRVLIHMDKINRRYLAATDGSTGRQYFIQVPITVQTCNDAYKAYTRLDSDKCLGQG